MLLNILNNKLFMSCLLKCQIKIYVFMTVYKKYIFHVLLNIVQNLRQKRAYFIYCLYILHGQS